MIPAYAGPINILYCVVLQNSMPVLPKPLMALWQIAAGSALSVRSVTYPSITPMKVQKTIIIKMPK